MTLIILDSNSITQEAKIFNENVLAYASCEFFLCVYFNISQDGSEKLEVSYMFDFNVPSTA